MKIKYIGSFPPPYGGVTVKNKLLFEEISKYFVVEKGKPKKSKWNMIYQIMCTLLPNQKLIIGVSAVGGKSKIITSLLYYFNRSVLRESIYFMMGGQECFRIASSTREKKWYSNYKKIYVETESMCKTLEDAGMKNVELYPNCRRIPLKSYERKEKDLFHCVFFSMINETKGVDIILEVSRKLKDVIFDFYGPIHPEYKEKFLDSVNSMKNVIYHGVFDSTEGDIYQELNYYDILLLPTKWKNEGVPGILVEAKIAGIPAVVSNIAYNAEIVKNGFDGVVLKENISEQLEEVITVLKHDRKKLNDLRSGCKESAQKYLIENYIEKIANQLM